MMRKSIKGALLSGLVFPGLGQIALQRYARGVVLILAVMSALFVMILTAVQQAYAILDSIETEGSVPDSETIRQAAEQAASASDSVVIPVMALLIGVCWIAATIDAYRIGRQQDHEQQLSGPRPHREGGNG